MNQPRIVGSLAVLAALGLAGCGADAEDTAQPGADTTAQAAEEATVLPAPDGAIRMQIHPTLPPYDFVLHAANPETVDSIVVTAQGEPVQTLRPGDNAVGPESNLERLTAMDLDFDGYQDLAFVALHAMVNSTSRYWRFDPTARRFEPAGEFDTLTPDSTTREFTSYNRGGNAGALYEANRWRWIDGELVSVRKEEQMQADDGVNYVRVVTTRADNGPPQVTREPVSAAEVEAGT